MVCGVVYACSMMEDEPTLSLTGCAVRYDQREGWMNEPAMTTGQDGCMLCLLGELDGRMGVGCRTLRAWCV